MGDRGRHTDEPVEPPTMIETSVIAAELVDALTNAVSSLGLRDRSDSLVEPERVPTGASPAVGS